MTQSTTLLWQRLLYRLGCEGRLDPRAQEKFDTVFPGARSTVAAA